MVESCYVATTGAPSRRTTASPFLIGFSGPTESGSTTSFPVQVMTTGISPSVGWLVEGAVVAPRLRRDAVVVGAVVGRLAPRWATCVAGAVVGALTCATPLIGCVAAPARGTRPA